MLARKPYTILVCLLFVSIIFAAGAAAYSIKKASAPMSAADLFAPAAPQYMAPRYATIPAAAPARIAKVRPIRKVRSGVRWGSLEYDPWRDGCLLPLTSVKGWEISADVLFARAKGRVRYVGGDQAMAFMSIDEVDFNGDLGLPDHAVIGSVEVSYRFRPKWSVRYSLMPSTLNGSGTAGRDFVFGGNSYNTMQNTQVKWERLYHRAGLVYDPIRTCRARVSVFGEYVRIDEKLSVIEVGCCGDSFDNELNMGMAGLEFERCLQTGRFCNTLSLQCRAGVAFLDEAFGSDIRTGVRYSIPMGNGRWGYLEGGYRYLTFKKGYSDFKQIDTCMEGGFLKMGFLF